MGERVKVTVKLSKDMIDFLDMLVKVRIFDYDDMAIAVKNRSDAIRLCIFIAMKVWADLMDQYKDVVMKELKKHKEVVKESTG